jgi:hypothetical protein
LALPLPFSPEKSMTSEEMNRTMEFIVQQSAQFSVQMDQLFRGLGELKESTARFEHWASEVVSIQSARLDQHDRFHRDGLRQNERFQNQALDLLHRILDKLEPPQKN